MEKTLYDYIIEEYGFNEDKKRIIIMIYDCDDLMKIEATPTKILKSFSFYELNMFDVLSANDQVVICQRFI